MNEFLSHVLLAVIAATPGTLALLVAIRKLTAEKKKLTAEGREANGAAAESFAQAAALTAQKNVELQHAVETLCKRVDAQDGLIEKLNERTVYLEGVLVRCAKRIAYLMGGIEMLVRQLNSLNAQPAWTPDEWEMYEENNPCKGGKAAAGR